MNNHKPVQKNVKKEYQLDSQKVYFPPEPVPHYIENPFTRGGLDVEWEIPPKTQRFRPTVSDVGYSSKKLFCCGDVWYLKEYFDAAGETFPFRYGPLEKREMRSELVEEIKRIDMLNVTAAPEYLDGDPILEELTEISRNETLQESPETPEKREWTEEEKQEKRKINRAHAKQNLRMLCNLNTLHYMYTLTFAPELHENVKGLRFILPLEKQHDRHEIEKAWNKRRSAISRWYKKHDREFRYVKVLEKHLGNNAEEESCKVGTYHIHLATDKPIDKHILQKLWGYGVVWIDDFSKGRSSGTRSKQDPGRDKAVIDPGVYMSKYMEKDFDDAALHGYKAYSPSHSLKRPKPIRDESEIAELLQQSHAESHTVYDTTFEAKYKLYRQGEAPEQVTLMIRSRIFNFRSGAQKVARTCPIHAGGVGVSSNPPPNSLPSSRP